jgi:hemerythrin-like metal-binding protein
MMKREIVWIDNYSVGVKQFDDQHKTILNELNKLYVAFESNSEAEDLLVVLKALIDYANVHFTTEEQVLEKYKYHDLDSQKIEHHLYQQKIESFLQRFEAEGHLVILETIGFLADWWMGHIQGCDREYTRFLNNNGVY